MKRQNQIIIGILVLLLCGSVAMATEARPSNEAQSNWTPPPEAAPNFQQEAFQGTLPEAAPYSQTEYAPNFQQEAAPSRETEQSQWAPNDYAPNFEQEASPNRQTEVGPWPLPAETPIPTKPSLVPPAPPVIITPCPPPKTAPGTPTYDINRPGMFNSLWKLFVPGN